MWKVDVLGGSWREGDLTLDQRVELETILGVDWGQMHPLKSALQAREILTSLYASANNLSREDAAAKVGQVKTGEFISGVGTYDDLPTEYDEGFPPVAAGAVTDT